jgi:hypothetical protein
MCDARSVRFAAQPTDGKRISYGLQTDEMAENCGINGSNGFLEYLESAHGFGSAGLLRTAARVRRVFCGERLKTGVA